MLELYGPNIVTAEGKQWQFHVRITRPPFNEANNHLNWAETLRQAQSLSDSWGRWGSRDLHLDIYSLTLNVISCAGFGVRQDWSNDTILNHDKVPEGHELSLLQAITTVVHYLVPILLLPRKVMLYSPLRKGAKAYLEFEEYMRTLINAERRKIDANADYENSDTKGNLLTAMLKVSVSEAKNANKGDDGSRKTTFTDDEVLGNAFMFFLAGKRGRHTSFWLNVHHLTYPCRIRHRGKLDDIRLRMPCALRPLARPRCRRDRPCMGRGGKRRPDRARLRSRFPKTQVYTVLHGKSERDPFPRFPHFHIIVETCSRLHHSTKSSAPSPSSSTSRKCAGSPNPSSGARARKPTAPRTSSPPSAACTSTR